MHEAKSSPLSAFVTLTYNEKNLPEDLSLKKKDVQDFFKRLRKKKQCSNKLCKKYNYTPDAKKIRYYAAGEYGDINEMENVNEQIKYISRYGSAKLGRPHYHCIIFNYWPEDSKKIGQYWSSKTLEDTWQKGFVVVGEVTFESASYTARYVTKKMRPSIDDREARFHYKGRAPEFALMSRGNASNKGRACGIGRSYYEEYKKEIWNNNSVVSRGREVSAPRYYKDRLKVEDWKLWQDVKTDSKHTDNSPKRMADIEKYLLGKEKFYESKKIKPRNQNEKINI